jgi:hypothetical protein
MSLPNQVLRKRSLGAALLARTVMSSLIRLTKASALDRFETSLPRRITATVIVSAKNDGAGRASDPVTIVSMNSDQQSACGENAHLIRRSGASRFAVVSQEPGH